LKKRDYVEAIGAKEEGGDCLNNQKFFVSFFQKRKAFFFLSGAI
jgi:hypothetical protein